MSSSQSQDRPSLDRIAELQQMIADFSQVQRYMQFANTGRKENDAEHSFGLAVTSWFLASKLAPHLDLGKILQYAIAHDIVELHAGDTYIFDEEKVSTKSEREDEALKQLFEDLPDFSEFVQAAKDYKDKKDAEAKFVYTVDKMLPPLMVVLSDDKDFWKRNKVTREKHAAEKNDKMRHSPELEGYAKELNQYLADREAFYESTD